MESETDLVTANMTSLLHTAKSGNYDRENKNKCKGYALENQQNVR